MKDMKPCIRENSVDHLIYHVGTNNVPSSKKAKCFAEWILSFAKEVKASKLDVSISSIVPRNDNWKNKVMEVNSYLKDLCKSSAIPFIINKAINLKNIEKTRFNVNPKGSNKLCDNFVMYMELKLSKKKIFLCCSYNHHQRFISNLLIDIGKNLDLLSTNYDNILLLVDYNAELENNFLKEFCHLYGMERLTRVPTCCENLVYPTCIDQMLTNSNWSFQNSCTIKAGLSDFCKMILTLLKIYFQ